MNIKFRAKVFKDYIGRDFSSVTEAHGWNKACAKFYLENQFTDKFWKHKKEKEARNGPLKT